MNRKKFCFFVLLAQSSFATECPTLDSNTLANFIMDYQKTLLENIKIDGMQWSIKVIPPGTTGEKLLNAILTGTIEQHPKEMGNGKVTCRATITVKKKEESHKSPEDSPLTPKDIKKETGLSDELAKELKEKIKKQLEGGQYEEKDYEKTIEDFAKEKKLSKEEQSKLNGFFEKDISNTAFNFASESEGSAQDQPNAWEAQNKENAGTELQGVFKSKIFSKVMEARQNGTLRASLNLTPAAEEEALKAIIQSIITNDLTGMIKDVALNNKSGAPDEQAWKRWENTWQQQMTQIYDVNFMLTKGKEALNIAKAADDLPGKITQVNNFGHNTLADIFRAAVEYTNMAALATKMGGDQSIHITDEAVRTLLANIYKLLGTSEEALYQAHKNNFDAAVAPILTLLEETKEGELGTLLNKWKGEVSKKDARLQKETNGILFAIAELAKRVLALKTTAPGLFTAMKPVIDFTKISLPDALTRIHDKEEGGLCAQGHSGRLTPGAFNLIEAGSIALYALQNKGDIDNIVKQVNAFADAFWDKQNLNARGLMFDSAGELNTFIEALKKI